MQLANHCRKTHKNLPIQEAGIEDVLEREHGTSTTRNIDVSARPEISKLLHQESMKLNEVDLLSDQLQAQTPKHAKPIKKESDEIGEEEIHLNDRHGQFWINLGREQDSEMLMRLQIV